MTKKEIEQIQVRCDKATALGDWIYNATTNTLTVGAECFTCYLGELKNKDADFITHARQDIPALVDALNAETKRADEAEAERDKYKARYEALENNFCPECGCSEWKSGLPNGEKICLECCQLYFDDVDYSDIIGKHLRSYKKRCEALERAINKLNKINLDNINVAFKCYLCTKKDCNVFERPCILCDGRGSMFQFDEARFRKGEGE